MSEWKLRAFWSDVTVESVETGFAPRLKGRLVKTPAKASLVLPTAEAAELVAKEWRAQEGEVDPTTMFHTRMANAAIDKVAIQIDEVVNLLADYGATDLICYRATHPAALVERQKAGWDPLIAWVDETYDVQLDVFEGVMFQAQGEEDLARLEAEIRKFTPFELAAFHDLVTLTGSLVLGIAAAKKAFDIDVIWSLSRIDEQYQIDEWGRDEEAEESAAKKHDEFRSAYVFFNAVQI